MSTDIQRYGRQILLSLKGVTLSMDSDQWKDVVKKIQCAILEAEAWGVAESVRWSEVLEIDTSVRTVGLFESLRPAELRLEQGQYVFVGEPNHQRVWSVFGESKLLTVQQLWQEGCFDSILLSDEELLPQGATTLIGRRLQWLSETMQWIQPNDSLVGDESIDAWDFERPQHTVHFTQGIWVGATPVTQQLFAIVMNDLPSMENTDQGALRPVVNVSWWDALLFCNRLSVKANRDPVYRVKELTDWTFGEAFDISEMHWERSANGYRLLTEAEWEAVARGWQPHEFSGSSTVNEVAWTNVDRVSRLPLVRQKKPNAWGLFDMSGLIWEWCWDAYDPEFYSSSPIKDPVCMEPHVERVCRGGSFEADPANARVSMRGRTEAQECWNRLGFRIACPD